MPVDDCQIQNIYLSYINPCLYRHHYYTGLSFYITYILHKGESLSMLSDLAVSVSVEPPSLGRYNGGKGVSGCMLESRAELTLVYITVRKR